MRRAVIVLGILTTGGMSLAFADPPATPPAPESHSTAAQNSTAEDNTAQHTAAQAAPASVSAPAAETPAAAPANSAAATAAPTAAAAPANPTAAATVATTPDAAPNATDERMQEKWLLNQGYKPGMSNGEKVFCKREKPIGSHIASELHCLTVAQAEMMAKEGKETTEHLQRSTPACLSPGAHGAPVCGN